METLKIIFQLIILLVAIPIAVFSCQIIFSLLPGKYSKNKHTQLAAQLPSFAILVPAHNEEQGIKATLDSIKAALANDERIVVIADNCDDRTAETARANGAIVIERKDALKRGKGYALDHGVRYLEHSNPPQVVIIVDADCLVSPNSLSLLAVEACLRNRPVQSLYLMHSPESSSLKTKIAEFAWAVKNFARPLGFYRLGLPCQLMGTGMAFPWTLIQHANLANGHIVEDMKLGLDFAKQKHAPLFCAEALVTSTFPLNSEGEKSQRTRWEHGHLDMICKEAPGLLAKSVFTLNLDMLGMVLDLCVPPLALLILLTTVLTGLSLLMMVVTVQIWPWMIAVLLLAILGFSVFLAWTKFGYKILSLNHLAFAPFYALMKIPLYLKFIIKRQAEWVRSKRD